MLFSLLKHYLDTDTAVKVSQSVYCFTSISHGVENYFPRLSSTGISDTIFYLLVLKDTVKLYFLKSSYLIVSHAASQAVGYRHL